MQQVRDFLANLPDAVRPVPQAPLPTRHYGQFLRQAETFWGEHGATILDSLADEQEQLSDAGQEVANAILIAVDEIRVNFVAEFEALLNTRCPDTAPHKVAGTKLGEALDQWIDGRADAVRDFRVDPLRQPAWLAIGNDDSYGKPAGHGARRSSGIWALAGQSLEQLAGAQLNMAKKATKRKRRQGQPDRGAVEMAAEDAWQRSLRNLPHAQINRYRDSQGRSRWTAAHCADLLLGTPWLDSDPDDRLGYFDSHAGSWFAAMRTPFMIWFDSNRHQDDAPGDPQIMWIVGPSGRGDIQRRRWREFDAFRRQGTLMETVAAEPYALMVAYSVSALAELSKQSPGADASGSPATEQLLPPVGSGIQLREVELGWEVCLNGVNAHVKGSTGAKYLAELAREPGRAIPCIELRSIAAGDIAGVTSPDEHDQSAPSAASNAGDLVCDQEAIDACRSHLDELRAQHEYAEEQGDLETQETIAEEMQACETYLKTATFQGKPRGVNTEIEKARKSVTAALRRAITAIEAADPTIGSHLRASVQLGKRCSYTPTATRK